MTGRHVRRRTRRESWRRWGSLSTVVVLSCGIAAGSTSPAGSADIRTDTTLGGFSIKTSTAPIKVLLDDPTLAIPHEPGTAVLEVDPSYTAATLEAGPASRALASSLWPGNLLGDGLGAATNGQIAGYPLKADARYPDKPYTDTGKGCIPQSAQCVSDNGVFMSAQALGLDVKAVARTVPADPSGTVDFALATSTSTATVKDGVASGTAESKVTDVSLLGGMITIGSVSSKLSVRGDGKKADSTGTTVVTNLKVGDYGFAVDETGAHLVGAPVPGSGPLPNAFDPLKALGITIGGFLNEHTASDTTATRRTSGLVIEVDTTVLRGVLNNIPSEVYGPIYTIIGQMPKELQGNLYYLLGATPKITFVLGAGEGVAAASLPLSFSFPPPPDLGGFPPVTGGPATGGASGPVGAGGPIGLPGGSVGPPPVTGGPVTAPPLVEAASKDPFKGLTPAQLLLVALLAGLGGWGLVKVRTLSFAGTAAAGPCTDGTEPSLPDLRGV